MTERPVLVGIGTVGPDAFDDRAIDEATFAATRAALHDAGVSKSDVDISIVASIDVFDGQSMSNGITTPAAAGWLTGEYRVEADSGIALVAGAAAIASNSAEVAVVVGVHWPASVGDALQFATDASSVSFEPAVERALGLSAVSALGLHAARQIVTGSTTRDEMAVAAARDARKRGASVDPADILAADTVAWPLTRAMVSVADAGVVAVVLASPMRARMLRCPRVRLLGQGVGTGGSSMNDEWFHDPAASTRRAAEAAYRRASIATPSTSIAAVEMTAPSIALLEPLRTALMIEGLPEERWNPGRGALGGAAGAASGLARVADAVRWLDEHGETGSRAVAHAADYPTGPFASSATVHVLERI
jgi:hypothetical protein